MSYIVVKSTGRVYKIEDVLDKEHEPRLVNHGYYIEDNYRDGRVDVYELVILTVDPWNVTWVKVEDGVDVDAWSPHFYSKELEN